MPPVETSAAVYHISEKEDNVATWTTSATTGVETKWAVPEHIHRSRMPGPAQTSFSNTFFNAKTEDLTGLVKRDSEYPSNGGGYADVYIGKLTRKGRSIKVAIKVIRSHTYTASNQWKIDKRLRREIRLWALLRHPNVVPLLGTTTGFGPYLAMVCPWMEHGNLSQYLNKKVLELTLRKRLQILADVIEGLAYLHSQSVIHGDLTTGNILMDEDRAHLSDFGLSNAMAEVRHNSFISSTVGGSPRWAAPELLHFGLAVPDVTKYCDIYSLGGVMLQTITGRIPYENILLDVQVLMEVMKGRTPARPPEALLSDELWNLILSCWTKEPAARPEIGQLREYLHVIRYECSEEELSANIVFPEKLLPGQDDDMMIGEAH
ncbi:Serine/threonine/tyrosine-protein kinase HT1 [Psilocybe cubensis]|nr:Serine/threonine/tyrosine-protein kinase HT1 [Psilocybe cubensis]KAH9475505.1 Serine/threonine/tyrosine-protein kinase HT1 [Psilocybe cubensis]